jgi:histone H3/H4
MSTRPKKNVTSKQRQNVKSHGVQMTEAEEKKYRAKQSKRARIPLAKRSWKTFIKRLVVSVQDENEKDALLLTVSSSAKSAFGGIINELIQRIGTEASIIMKANARWTMKPKDMATAVKVLMPGKSAEQLKSMKSDEKSFAKRSVEEGEAAVERAIAEAKENKRRAKAAKAALGTR